MRQPFKEHDFLLIFCHGFYIMPFSSFHHDYLSVNLFMDIGKRLGAFFLPLVWSLPAGNIFPLSLTWRNKPRKRPPARAAAEAAPAPATPLLLPDRHG